MWLYLQIPFIEHNHCWCLCDYHLTRSCFILSGIKLLDTTVKPPQVILFSEIHNPVLWKCSYTFWVLKISLPPPDFHFLLEFEHFASGSVWCTMVTAGKTDCQQLPTTLWFKMILYVWKSFNVKWQQVWIYKSNKMYYVQCKKSILFLNIVYLACSMCQHSFCIIPVVSV